MPRLSLSAQGPYPAARAHGVVRTREAALAHNWSSLAGQSATDGHPAVIAWRGEFIEAVHPFSAAAVDASGPLGHMGPTLRTPMRSAAKSLQLEVSLGLLPPPARAALLANPDFLAIGAASHSASARHLAVVDALMAQLGVTEADLRCGGHRPIDDDVADALVRVGQSHGARHNNCSGKHAVMVAAARALQATGSGDASDYLDAAHPLQRAIAAHTAAAAGEVPGLAVDGCGVPTFVLSLTAIARAFQRLAAAMVDDDDDAARPATGRALAGAALGDLRLAAAIGWAMARQPLLVSGQGRLDLLLTEQASEPIAVKIGAQGVFCLALPRRRLGIAVKVASGVTEALPTAVLAALDVFAPGAMPAQPAAWPFATLRNVVGREVGAYRLAGRLAVESPAPSR